MITLEKLKEYFEYNPVTGVFTRIKKANYNQKLGKKLGSLNKSTGYLQCKIFGQNAYIHRLAWLYVNGEWPVNEIDHIDGDKTNNRIKNLRPATHAQNNTNRDNHKNKYGFKGVKRHHSNKNRWYSMIQVEGRQIYLGMCDTPEEAYVNYCKAAERYHGDFARFV